MKNQKRKQNMVYLFLMLIGIMSSQVFGATYGGQLESSVKGFVEWGVRIIGYISFLGGGAWAAVDWQMNGGENFRKAIGVILGGVFLISLPKLYEILVKAIS